MIEVKQLSKKIGSQTVLNALSFKVQLGRILGLLGPNGAGKTSTLRYLSGYYEWEDSAQLMLNGVDVSAFSMSLKQSIGYCPEQAPVYPDMTVTEYLNFCAALKKMSSQVIEQSVQEMINVFQIEPVLNARIETLSKGTQQRVALAQTFLHSPQIVLLDEPLTGLDPAQVHRFRTFLKRYAVNAYVVFSSHQLHELEESCDDVVIIKEGTCVIQTTLDEIKSKHSSLEQFWLSV